MQLLCGMQWEIICSGDKNGMGKCMRFYAELFLFYDELRYNSTHSKAIEIEFARLHVPYCDNLIQCLISSNVTINVPVIMIGTAMHIAQWSDIGVRTAIEVRGER